MGNDIDSVFLVVRYTRGYREFEVFVNRDDAYKYKEDGEPTYKHTIIEQPLRYCFEERIKLYK